MRNKLAFLGLLLAPALMAAGNPQVVDGHCKLESAGEILTFSNINPKMHYGMFAVAVGPNNEQVKLSVNHPESYDVYIQTAGGHSAYAYFPIAANGADTVIKLGVVIASGEWLSCSVKVR